MKQSGGEAVYTIGIGWSGESRYIGICPPLSAEEIPLLKDAKLIKGGQLQHIIRPPKCTLVHLIDMGITPEEATLAAQATARAIADVLRSTRQSEPELNIEPVQLIGYNSTPFNPHTDSRGWRIR